MIFTICCSMIQIDRANSIKVILEKAGSGNVCHIPEDPKECQKMIDHMAEFLSYLDESDLVLIMTGPDGTIGECVAQELAYCIHNDIPYLMIDPKRPCVAF